MRLFLSLIAGLVLALPTTTPLLAQSDVTPVYIEDSPDADDLVKQAQVLRDQKRLTETAAMYQKLATDYGRKLMKVEGPVYVDAQRWVRLTVAQDAALLTAYRTLHEPVAARAVEVAMKPSPSFQALELVAQQYGLCDAGLEAALRAAALHLERGQPMDAGNLLDDFATHPGLAKQQERWHHLQATSALYARDATRLKLHTDALRKLAATSSLKQIQDWQSQLDELVSEKATTSFETLPKVELPSPLGTPLFVRDVQSDVTSPRGPSTDPSRQNNRSEDHHMIPSVIGDTIYLNTGLTLRAIDRSSLSDIWATPFTPGTVDGTAYDRFGVLGRDQAVRDQRGVMIDGDVITAVMGRVNSLGRGQVMAGTPDTLMVGVNRADGKTLWRKTPEQFDATFEQSFFHGTPVGRDGRAYIMVRRSQNSGFRDAYVIAVNLHDGSLLWKRHISSTTPGYTSRGFTHLLAHNGQLYVSDNLGAIACLDGPTGAMRWLHRMSQFKVIRSGPSSGYNAAWSVHPPVFCKAGLIVAPFMAGTSATLLDPATGKKLRDLDTEPFVNAAYYMAVNDGDVLTVGANVHYINGKTLDTKWSASTGDAGAPAARGIITGNRLMIPTSNWIVTINLDSGKKEADTPIDVTGNLHALDGQMIVAAGTSIRSYMTWPVVYENLMARIRKNPTDAQAGLSLAHAAIASDRAKEAIEGIDHVVAVLRHRAITRPQDVRPEADEIHSELFQQILRLSDKGVTKDNQLRGDIFDRIAKATVTPRDEAQYHLAFASYLLDGEWPKENVLERQRDAARHFQAVLENPMLAGQLVPRAGTWQQSGVEARMKLAAMIEKFGRAVYEEFDERAAAELNRLTLGGNPDATELVELTRKYPLAKTTAAAMLAAGESLARGGRHVDAITQLRRAYREKSALPLRDRIVGRLVEQYVRIGKPLRARQWLSRAERDNISPMRDGKAVTARTWLADLGDEAMGTQALPLLRDKLGKPSILAGSLLLPKSQPRDQWPLDRVVMQFGDHIQLRGGPAFERLWEAKLEPEAQLIWLNNTLCLFWIESSQTMVALDARSGKLLWKPIKAQALLKDMVGGAAASDPNNPQAQLPANQPPQGRFILRGGVIVDVGNDAPLLFQGQQDFRGGGVKLTMHGQPVPTDPWFAEQSVRVIINDAIACIADASGRLIGIDMDTGQIQWRFHCPFDRVDHLAISGECIAISGGIEAMANTETSKSIIIALDALTGDVITQIEAPANLMWLGLSEGDSLIYVDQPVDRRLKSKITIHRLPDGELDWRADLSTGRIDAVTLAGESILVLIDGTNLMVVEPLQNIVRDPLSSVLIERTDGVDVAATGDRWHLLTPNQCAAVKSDSKMIWRDGIDEEAGSRIVQMIGRERMLVVTYAGDGELAIPRLPPPQRLPDPRLQEDFTVTYRLFLLDRQGGSILQEYRLPLTAARIDAQQCVLLNHHVLLGIGAQTMVIPDAVK